jgi:FkbM family methyltransferase
MTLRSVSKASFRVSLRGLRATRAGRFVYEQLLDAILEDTATVRHNGVSLRLATPNWLARYRADTFATKEPETLEWLDTLSQDSTLWDVGANVGVYAVYAAKARGCNVLAFEPSVFNLELLARNVALNGLQDRITIVPVPLNEGPGVNRFRMSTTSWGGALSSFAHDVDQDGRSFTANFEYAMAGLSMDQARDRLELPQPTHIKIDVDGIEHFILSGAASVLGRAHSVLIEVNEEFREQALGVEHHLKAAGLTLHRKFDFGGGVFNQWWNRPAEGRRTDGALPEGTM